MRTDDKCVGVAALLPWALFQKLPPFQQLAKHWSKHADADCKPKLQSVLRSSRAAVLVSERVHNAPPSVAAPILAILQRDLQACESCGDADVSQHAQWDHLLVCAKAYIDAGQDVARTGAVKVSVPHARKGKGKVWLGPITAP
jgi:BCCIP